MAVRYGYVMLKTWLLNATVAAVTAGGAVTAGFGVASADPGQSDVAPPPPPMPDVVSFAPISPVDYTLMEGNWYAFAGPAGVVCVINKQTVSYGGSGARPGAPEGANLVSGGPSGPPAFSTSGRPFSAPEGQVKTLPPNTRLSFREISCGVDGAGVVACVNSRDQVGFMVTPTGTFIDDVMPLLARPDSAAPLLPGLPPG